MSNSRSYKTLCVHGGKFNDSLSHGSVTPIFPATSHAYLDMEKITYPRYYNTPNQEVLAAKIAALEHGEAGLVFASGMAAISTTLLALLEARRSCCCPDKTLWRDDNLHQQLL